MIIKKIKASQIVFTTFPSSLLSNVLSVVKQSCVACLFSALFSTCFTLAKLLILRALVNPYFCCLRLNAAFISGLNIPYLNRRSPLKQKTNTVKFLVFTLSLTLPQWALANNSCQKIFFQNKSATSSNSDLNTSSTSITTSNSISSLNQNSNLKTNSNSNSKLNPNPNLITEKVENQNTNSVRYSNQNPNIHSIQNAIHTWLKWEQLYNLPEYQRSVLTMPLQASPIAKENFSVQYFSTDAKNNLHDLIFTSDNFINWYKHPTNTAATVPYFSTPAVDTHIMAKTTASRSLSFQWNKALYSIKLATNHPHEGKYAVDKKASVQEDILLARSRSPYINQTEDLIGTDKNISIVKELAVVVDQKSNEGYIVRDLSFLLTPDRFYLPAFSIPYAAAELGLSTKSQDRFDFWQQHYAQALGQAKAKLLLRYGLQMETPNPQNILIELDQNYKTTGRIMFRDISDMTLVRTVAFAFGARKQLAIDLKNGIHNSDFIDPNAELSFLFFDRSESEPYWNKRNLNQWTQAHNQSYILEIEQSLQLDLSEIKQTGNFQKLYQLLQSPEGQDKLRQYRQKQIALHNEQNQAEHSKRSNSNADDASKARTI